MSVGPRARGVPWRELQLGAWGTGIAGLVIWVLAVVLGGEELRRKAFFSYLFAYTFCLAFPLGSLAIWMLHNQTGGAWGLIIRRYLEAATRLIPFLALLFIPIFFGLADLYVWADPALVHQLHHGEEVEELIKAKGNYLTAPWYIIRTCFYFAIWTLIAWLLNRRQVLIDRDPTNRFLARRQQVFSGPAIGLYGLAMTFAAIDWLMSLEPTWYSTIFGVLVIMGQTLPALAFAIAAAAWMLDRKEVVEAETDRESWNDLGNLLLAAVMLWTYMSFSQLMLIWIGNLPEEITWYLKRSNGGWEYLGWVLGVGYFAVPFLLLLARGNKRDPRRLMGIGVCSSSSASCSISGSSTRSTPRS